MRHRSVPVQMCSAILVLGGVLAGCQLLRPYQGPWTPTPNHWKTTYSAPDAGKKIIPDTWKEEFSSALPEDLKEDIHSSEERKERDSNQKTSANADPDPAPSEEMREPCFEDVRRNLYNWWEVFNDPVLNELEEQALDSSYTLWAALERVIQARNIARIAFAPLLPGVNFSPSFNRMGSLVENPLQGVGVGSAGGTGTGSATSSSNNPVANVAEAAIASALNSFPRDFRFVQTQYLVPLNLNYEIDLWSQLNNAYYAALIRAQAASQAYLSVLLSLTADVASAYFQVRSLDTQQEVIMRNVRARQRALEINRARYNAGLIVYLDVSRAEVEVARGLSDSDDARRLRGLQENLLATLVGIPAPVFSLAIDPVLIPPPVIPTGLPSELLCRRPDIAEAERNLAAAYRDVGVAYADFFPSLTLNASLGFETPFIHQLFSWQSRFWQVGWDMMQTVFDAGRTDANYDYYQARFSEAMANYQETVLQSFKDVEDALVNLREYARQAQDLEAAVKAARLTLELAQMRYDRGLINYLSVVDAERQLLETEQSSAIVLGSRYVSTVRLVKALGGGWGPCEDCLENDSLEN